MAVFYKVLIFCASLLGEIENNEGINGVRTIMSEKVFSYPYSCFSIQQAAGTSVTIPNTYFGGIEDGKCSILFITQNTKTPSVFVLGRKTVAGTIYEGNGIKQSDLSFNNDGSLTVTKIAGLALYFRVLIMEW